MKNNKNNEDHENHDALSIVNSQEEIEKEEIDPVARIMEKPFNPSQINIETKTPSLDTLIKRIKNEEIRMNPDSYIDYFQRKDDLWNEEKQSRLIESILIRFPLPAFFFDATEDNNWLVVDGLQRLSSIRNFCVNKELKLNNLEFLGNLNGKGWDELDGNLQRTIEETQVVIYKIMPGTPVEVKFNIFKRINTGGLVLEPQEIRHALFQGKPATFIAELAKNEDFLNATNKKIATHRMLDRDFVNRFLCFYLFGADNYGTKEYGLDLDTFMSKAMAAINDKSKEELDKIKIDFSNAMKLSKTIFEKEAFRKVYKEYSILPPINKALFDAVATQFSLLTEDERKILKERKDGFKKALLEELSKQNGSDFYISVTSSTADKKRIIKRHSFIKELINKIINQTT